MLRKIIENKTGIMTDEEFKEVCETVTKDIKGNQLWLGQKSTLRYVVYVAGASLKLRRRLVS